MASSLSHLVSGNDDIDRLDGSSKVLVGLLQIGVELQKHSVKFVDEKNRFDSLRNGLSQHSLGLDTDTLDTVNNLNRRVIEKS